MRQALRIVATGLVLAGLTGTVQAADQKDVHAILDKAIKSMGGEKALAKHRTMTWITSGTYYGMGGDGIEFRANYALQLPDKYRFEINNLMFSMTFVVNGNHGWVKTNGETHDLSKDDLVPAHQNLYLDRLTTLLLLKRQGYELSALGESKVGDHDVVGIKVVHKGHPTAKMYFDKKSGRLVAVDARVKQSPQEGGNEVDQRSIYSDYKDINGVPFPTRLTILRDNNKFVEGETSNVQFVKELPAKDFEKP